MAIDSASAGDTVIYVPFGTYTEALIIDKSIILNAQFGGCFKCWWKYYRYFN